MADYNTANNGSVDLLDVTIVKELYVTFLQMYCTVHTTFPASLDAASDTSLPIIRKGFNSQKNVTIFPDLRFVVNSGEIFRGRNGSNEAEVQ